MGLKYTYYRSVDFTGMGKSSSGCKVTACTSQKGEGGVLQKPPQRGRSPSRCRELPWALCPGLGGGSPAPAPSFPAASHLHVADDGLEEPSERATFLLDHSLHFPRPGGGTKRRDPPSAGCGKQRACLLLPPHPPNTAAGGEGGK